MRNGKIKERKPPEDVAKRFLTHFSYKKKGNLDKKNSPLIMGNYIFPETFLPSLKKEIEINLLNSELPI